MLKRIFSWLEDHWVIVLILIVASFFRLYRISDYMTFLGDEGRDALVWLRMVQDGKFTLIGPRTSIGDMYLGPLYYYLMLPFFIIFSLNPVGPSIGVALLSLLTIFLIWRFCKEWFDEKVGLIAAALYAISPVVIYHSRSSWNPNVMPFFSLLTVWGIWQVWQKGNFFWLLVIGIGLSFAVQSHYLGLLLIPLVGIFWFLSFLEIRNQRGKIKKYFLWSLVGLGGFLLLTIAPLVWFDLRHNFLNYNSFLKFFSDRQETVNFKLYKALPNLWPIGEMVVARLLGAKEILWGKIIAIGFFVMLVPVSFANFTRKKTLLLMCTWLIVGLVGLGIYKQHIYDHYFGFLFPVIFIMAALILSFVYQFGRLGKSIFVLLFVVLVFLNLKNSPLRESPNLQMIGVQEVDKKIIAEADGKPFNFGLIAKQNYEEGYSFYLEYWKKKPVDIDAQRLNETLTGQLFVVCEDPICEPINNAKSQVANFGWAKIDQQWEFPWGVKLFKLVHSNKD